LCHRDLIFLEFIAALACYLPVSEENMDTETIFTKEKSDAVSEKIVRVWEENKIVGSANIITYAIRESWLAGFEEGRKYPLKESK
jgi:hypothetical protein